MPEHAERPTDELPDAERASTLFLVVVASVSAVADLATKAWAHANLAGFDFKRSSAKTMTVIPNHLDFIFAQNPGGAWSFLRGLPDGLRRPFFLFISAAAIVFIYSIYTKVHKEQTAMKWGLSLALGGAVGNLVDRIRYGWVIDFIDVYITRGGRELHWPTFNVADIAIVIGVFLMAMDMVGAARRAGDALPALEGAQLTGADAAQPASTDALATANSSAMPTDGAAEAEPRPIGAEPRPVEAEPRPVEAEPRPVEAEPRPLLAEAPPPVPPTP